MFDVSFSELLVIGIVGLIVIGPERLPEVARTLGKYVGRVRRFVAKVKDDIDREIRQEELREALKRNADIDEIKNIINDSRYTIENELNETKGHVVQARDDDPRGDFSQQTMLQDQEKDFEHVDYGLTDHRDYGKEHAPGPSENTTAITPTSINDTPASPVAETAANSQTRHDGQDGKTNS